MHECGTLWIQLGEIDCTKYCLKFTKKYVIKGLFHIHENFSFGHLNLKDFFSSLPKVLAFSVITCFNGFTVVAQNRSLCCTSIFVATFYKIFSYLTIYTTTSFVSYPLTFSQFTMVFDFVISLCNGKALWVVVPILWWVLYLCHVFIFGAEGHVHMHREVAVVATGFYYHGLQFRFSALLCLVK